MRDEKDESPQEGNMEQIYQMDTLYKTVEYMRKHI